MLITTKLQTGILFFLKFFNIININFSQKVALYRYVFVSLWFSGIYSYLTKKINMLYYPLFDKLSYFMGKCTNCSL